VDRAHARHDRDPRPGDLAQLRDLPQAAHPHLGDHDLGVRLDARKRERKADLVVVPAIGGDDPGVRCAEGSEDVLRRRLARGARDADDGRLAARADDCADRRERAELVVGMENRGRAARERMLGEVPAAGHGDEQVALFDAPRVDLHPRRLVGPARPDQTTERLELGERERDHALAPSERSASLATSRSSKGSTCPSIS
jgi:hypothetical protein